MKAIHPHNDALVVSLKVTNNLVHRVLIDNGSSVDVFFKSALDKMNLEGAKLKPVKKPLYNFAGERIDAERIITLLTTLGEAPQQVIRMIDCCQSTFSLQCNPKSADLERNTSGNLNLPHDYVVPYPLRNQHGLRRPNRSKSMLCGSGPKEKKPGFSINSLLD